MDQPGQNFVRLEICRQEQVIGCVILAYMAPDRVYNYSRVNIVDMVVATRADDLFAVIHAAVCFSRKELDTDALIMHVINPPIELALERYGFLRRQAARHLMASVDDDGDCQTLMDASRWLVTQGDSDIDRPGQRS